MHDVTQMRIVGSVVFDTLSRSDLGSEMGESGSAATAVSVGAGRRRDREVNWAITWLLLGKASTMSCRRAIVVPLSSIFG